MGMKLEEMESSMVLIKQGVEAMLLHGLNILNQKLWSSKKQHVMELQNRMHPLPAKVT
ncbi:Hypothetical predicted protein [Olea europaea subsp. europaea]|uniref:Uncharacterized protein n=1 Tax=Olea europaea subsp. europaea TaxID=158383 RepID=A0A8S0VKB1_OLEEU|nr:Hypothetical predicted protein [Olea europaea subsp. europaea]